MMKYIWPRNVAITLTIKKYIQLTFRRQTGIHILYVHMLFCMLNDIFLSETFTFWIIAITFASNLLLLALNCYTVRWAKNSLFWKFFITTRNIVYCAKIAVQRGTILFWYLRLVKVQCVKTNFFMLNFVTIFI